MNRAEGTDISIRAAEKVEEELRIAMKSTANLYTTNYKPLIIILL